MIHSPGHSAIAYWYYLATDRILERRSSPRLITALQIEKRALRRPPMRRRGILGRSFFFFGSGDDLPPLSHGIVAPYQRKAFAVGIDQLKLGILAGGKQETASRCFALPDFTYGHLHFQGLRNADGRSRGKYILLVDIGNW